MGNLLKEKVLKFKLKHCCWIAPVHYGVLLLAYFNLAVSMASLLCAANENFRLPLKQVQEEVLEDGSNSVTSCTLAYSVEEAINVALIIGIHRRDLALLNLYMFVGAGVAMLTLFVYIIVIVKVGATTSLILLAEIFYDCYVLLLVRSEIVNIKEASKEAKLSKKSIEENSGDEEKGEKNISDEDVEGNQTNQETVKGWKRMMFKNWSRSK